MTEHVPSPERRTRPASLTHRLLVAQSLVVAAMTGTILVAAAVIGPPVFDHHMRQAGHVDQPLVLEHAAEAFRSAGFASMAAGLVIAAVGAVLAGVLLTRGIGRALDALTLGAERVAAGRYDDPVEMPPTSRELQSVADAFNGMAARVAATEETRRRMLTDLSHELRTPLAAIDITLEAVEDGVRELDAETLATLRAQTGRLARLAGDIKDVSAAEEGFTLDRERTDVATLLDAAQAGAAAAYATAGVALEVEHPDPCTIVVDPHRIGQVLDNLLRNARQHTPAGGRVRLSVRRARDSVVIDVTDDGAGIAAEHLPHVFERFYRVDAGRARAGETGSGVGLAVSRAIAVAHGGALTARSPGPGQGSTFSLRLPLLPR